MESTFVHEEKLTKKTPVIDSKMNPDFKIKDLDFEKMEEII